MSHTGSLLIIPSGIYGWRPETIEEVSETDFAPVLAEIGDIRFLLIGTGRAMALPPEPIRLLLAAKGLALEAMDTGAAVRTYNVLLAEDRPPAAALIAVN
jgi:uncharacterized protein